MSKDVKVITGKIRAEVAKLTGDHTYLIDQWMSYKSKAWNGKSANTMIQLGHGEQILKFVHHCVLLRQRPLET